MGICNYYSELFSNKIYDILYDCANEVFYKKELFLDPFSDISDSEEDDSENEDSENEDNESLDKDKCD